jgi:hypothetical protein
MQQTIIALILVSPPSAKVPANEPRAGWERVASHRASNDNEGCIMKECRRSGRSKERNCKKMVVVLEDGALGRRKTKERDGSRAVQSDSCHIRSTSKRAPAESHKNHINQFLNAAITCAFACAFFHACAFNEFGFVFRSLYHVPICGKLRYSKRII